MLEVSIVLLDVDTNELELNAGDAEGMLPVLELNIVLLGVGVPYLRSDIDSAFATELDDFAAALLSDAATLLTDTARDMEALTAAFEDEAAALIDALFVSQAWYCV